MNKFMSNEKVIDIDGNIYQAVKIGKQLWLAENLKVIHYRNGDPIQHIIDDIQWHNGGFGAYCNYGNDQTNATIYGCLYNWYAVNDKRNICPSGWHIPTEAEWTVLVNYLGGDSIAGGKMKEAGTIHWESPNTGAINISGFSALPGGGRFYIIIYLLISTAICFNFINLTGVFKV